MTINADQILIIDRNAEDRERLAAYLSERGYFVSTAESIALATLLAFETKPDLVFADVKNDEIAAIPFVGPNNDGASLIVISSTESAGDVVACLRAGADDFILKPVLEFASVDHVIDRTIQQIRVTNLNKRLRTELEVGNKKLREGIHELRRDLKAGLQVQLKMLPEQNKRLQGYDFAHIVRPSLYLSGDFLDYFRIDDHRCMFYFADVSGHGASSAFVTVLLKNLTVRLLRNFKRSSSDEITCPARFLKRVNQELIASDLGKHITIFAGLLREENNQLSYAIGGHFPLPIISSLDETAYLEGKGVAVGLFPEPEFEVYQRVLPRDFRITIFSDGILEIIRRDSLVEKENLLLNVVSESFGGIESLLSSLGMDDIDELPDDIAVMTVSRSNKT
jgi:sigma-B regulation protein RsbU (phosphoserine phosphatase)